MLRIQSQQTTLRLGREAADMRQEQSGIKTVIKKSLLKDDYGTDVQCYIPSRQIRMIEEKAPKAFGTKKPV